MIDWQDRGPGEKDPDRATEVFFWRKVSHLGIVPHQKCDLNWSCMSSETHHIESKLLGTSIPVKIFRIFRIVYHDGCQEKFSQNHNVIHSSQKICDAIKAYHSGKERYLDAIIELTHMVYGGIYSHRFNVYIFPSTEV